MSSLSEHERVGLDDLFLSLSKDERLGDKLKEQKNRLVSSLAQVVSKGVPIGISYIKSKKNVFLQGAKLPKTKLFKQFRPKNRDSK